MARIEFNGVPTVAPTGAPGGRENISASPEMFGGLIAQGEQKLGQGVEAVGEAGLNYLQAKQDADNETHVAEKQTHFAGVNTQRLEAFKQLRGRDAKDRLEQFNTTTQDLHQELLKDEPPKVQAMLARAVAPLVDRYQFSAASHAATEEKSWSQQTALGNAKMHYDQASLDAQEHTFEHIDQSVFAGNDQLRRYWQGILGASEEAKPAVEQKVKEGQGGAILKGVRDLVDRGDVPSARALLEAYRKPGPAGPGMDAGSIAAADAHLKSVEAQIEGQRGGDEEYGRAYHDISDRANYRGGRMGEVKGFIFHHTSGSGTPEGVVDTLNQRGLGVQYVMDRDGKIYRTLPDGAKGAHIQPSKINDLTNANTEGMEIIAKNDADVTPAQVESAKRFAAQYSKDHPGVQYFGHGEVNPGHKEADEGGSAVAAVTGRKIVEAARSGEYGAPPEKADVIERLLRRYENKPRELAAAISRVNLLSSADRAQTTQNHVLYQQRYKDTVAEAKETGHVTNPLTPEDFRRLPNTSPEQRQQLNDDYDDTLAMYADLHAAAAASPADRAALVPPLPQPGPGYDRAVKRRDAFRAGLNHLDEQRKADPAGYAMANLPDVKAAFQGMAKVENDPKAPDDARRAARANYAAVMRDEQIRVGVDPANVHLLGTEAAAALNKTFATAADSEDPQARRGLVDGIQKEAALWGDNWPAVTRQLAPVTQPIVRAIAAGADPTAMVRLLNLGKDENPAKILKEQNETTFKDVTKSLNEAFAPFRSSMVGRQMDRDYGAYYGLGEKLAALYVRDGDSASDAAAKSFKALIGGRYDFRDTWRMPKSAGIGADDVQEGTEAVRLAIRQSSREAGGNPLNIAPAVNDIGLTDVRQDSLSKFARDGRFVTSHDNAGLNLVYGDNFVQTNDGKPLFFSWADLAKRAGTPEARKQALDRAALSGPQP